MKFMKQAFLWNNDMVYDSVYNNNMTLLNENLSP